MTLSMYQASVPVFLRALNNLQHVLRKGEAHAEARKYESSLLLQSRLTVDMLPLTRQVQIATDMAKNCCARLAGVDPLKFDDNETSFAELHARIDRAIEYIKSFKADQIDGSETRAITLKLRSGEQHFEGQGYLLHYVIPNVFFHCTTAYAILREAGADLGKADFIGKP
ncbi:DUF1993 domain-containing protein [Dyella silvae]|uniref:DUF1993 domain-containing protein n=1 Tax=Dyella silvae TaxID=2994424 RepID=UPI0022645D26|nr:DUF1993 domain-containing protein [Dyella silvae]